MSAAAASEGVAAPCAKWITKNQSGALERSGSERRRRSPVRKTDLPKPWRCLRVQQQRAHKGSLKTKAAPHERSGSERRRRGRECKKDREKPKRRLRAQRQRATARSPVRDFGTLDRKLLGSRYAHMSGYICIFSIVHRYSVREEPMQ